MLTSFLNWNDFQRILILHQLNSEKKKERPNLKKIKTTTKLNWKKKNLSNFDLQPK